MTYHYSATGERIEDIEPPVRNLTPAPAIITSRIPDAVVVAHCNELRRILREARARRKVAA